MTNPRVLFVLYYKKPPHTFELIERAEQQLEDLRYIHFEAVGSPAQTLNECLRMYHDHVTIQPDWVVGWDPHFQWLPDGVKLFMERVRAGDKDPRCGWVSAPVQVHGEQANGWAPFLKDMPGQVYRLLVAFRVAALQTIGGFHGVPPAGRNWLMTRRCASTTRAGRSTVPPSWSRCTMTPR